MRQTFQQRLIALMLLMAYTITGTSMLPAAMAFAAWMDGSHRVVISQSEQGTSLTLRHSQDGFTPRVDDHRNALARAIVRLCKAAEDGDHQLTSSRCESAASSERDDSLRAARQAPPINPAATFQLSLTAPQPARDTTRGRGFHAVSMTRHALGNMPSMRPLRI